jgi:hypothetical protein
LIFLFWRSPPCPSFFASPLCDLRLAFLFVHSPSLTCSISVHPLGSFSFTSSATPPYNPTPHFIFLYIQCSRSSR